MFIKPKRLLIIVSGAGGVIGGHKISAVTLAMCMDHHGLDVGLLIAPQIFDFIGLDDSSVTIHFSAYPDGQRAYFSKPYLSRPSDIYRVVRKYKYEALIAMDWQSASQAIPTAIRFGLPLVQIHAGGPIPVMPPYRLPGIIVFSEELKQGFHSKHRIPEEHLVLTSGRVDFNYYRNSPKISEEIHPLGFNPTPVRILSVSRLDQDKYKAMIFLLKEAENTAKFQAFQLTIIGNGKIREALEEVALNIVKNSGGMAEIRFAGGFRVKPSHLRQADLVIGQGRTVIEAMATGVPAAICGSNGYIGLITPENLLILSKTNLTGRQVKIRSNLVKDLEMTERYTQAELSKVNDMAYELYDASKGVSAIKEALELFETNYINPNALRRGLSSALIIDFLTWSRHWMNKVIKVKIG